MKHSIKVLLACVLAAALLFSATGCSFVLTSKPGQTEEATQAENAEYADKLEEIVALLDRVYVDGYSTEELGDLLFAAVKAGRFLGVDGELALHAACEKFIRRFRRVEELTDRPLARQDVPALEALWRRAKAEEAAEQTT